MTCCSDCVNDQAVATRQPSTSPPPPHHHHANSTPINGSPKSNKFLSCPSCGLTIKCEEKAGIHDLPGLPAGVKFDPSDQEIIEHLEGKVRADTHKLHPLIDEFIQTIEGENGICYTHPEKLPGVSKDGLVRHFFHRPSKAYTTGTRKRRKVHTDIDGCETRWHKTGKTRPVVVKGKVRGYKKILVLYTNYGRQRKPEKTNWVMHQYHLGNNEDEKEGELVVSKVFYQTQPRQCGGGGSNSSSVKHSPVKAINGVGHPSSNSHFNNNNNPSLVQYYNSTLISFDQCGGNRTTSRLIPNMNIQDNSFLP